MFDVAVITPTHNRATLIAAAIDSVLAQTILRQGQRIEMAIVDDGSTDHTQQVLAPYLAAHGKPDAPSGVTITYTHLAKQGVVVARNTAIAATTAPLIAILDSDDYWDPRKLELQQRAMAAAPDIGLCHTSFRYVNEAGDITDAGPQRLDNPCVGRCVDKLLDEFLVIFSSVLVKRDLVAAAAAAEPHGQPFDSRWTNAQDYDLVLRIARLAALAYVPEPLTFYRLHGAHGAMGNLKRAYGFHSKVQIDFVRRYGHEFNLTEADARRRAAAFVLGRAQSAFWRRQMTAVRDMCELARELEFHDGRFADLERKAARPAWMYRCKDAVDRLLGRGRS